MIPLFSVLAAAMLGALLWFVDDLGSPWREERRD
jgi:hypothetical protein